MNTRWLISFLCSRPCFLVGCGCSRWFIGICSALTIKRSNFMQTSVSHADPVTADMKRSSNKRKVCFAYSFVYCSFHCWLCNFRPNNICRHQRVQILLACCELHCDSISPRVCYTYERSIKENTFVALPQLHMDHLGQVYENM